MKKEPEQPNNDSVQDTESWSKAMHKRFVPDPGVMPIGETLAMARRIQKKAEPHALTQSLLNRYTKRRQDRAGSFGDMPFYSFPRNDEAPAQVVQGVFRESPVVQKKAAAPVIAAQPAASSKAAAPDHKAPETSKGETHARAAQTPSEVKASVSVQESRPMVPPSVSFARQVNGGKRTLVQRAMDRSDGSMGLVKAPVKTVIPHQTPAPVVQAKQVTGSRQSTPLQHPAAHSNHNQPQNRKGTHKADVVADNASSMADMPKVQARIQTGAPVQAKDMPVKKPSSQNIPSSGTTMASVAQAKAESSSPEPAPAKAVAPHSKPGPAHEAPPVVQHKTESTLPEPVSPKAVASHSNPDPAHGDLPVIRPNPGALPGGDQATMSIGKNDPPSLAPAIQQKLPQTGQNPVVQAKIRPTPAGAASKAQPQTSQPGVPDQVISSPGSVMPVIQSRSEIPLLSVKGKDDSHEQSGPDNPSTSGKSRGLSPTPPAEQTVQRVRETVHPDSGTSKSALETPLVLNDTTPHQKTDTPSMSTDTSIVEAPAHETAQPASSDMTDRPSDVSAASKTTAMPVVRPVQPAPDRIQGSPFFSGTPSPPVQAKAAPEGRTELSFSDSKQVSTPIAIQKKSMSGNIQVSAAPLPSSGEGMPVIQQVRVPEIQQYQRFDFGPMPMARANKTETSQSTASNSPVQRQSGHEARAQQGPSTGASAASQPSPASMDPVQAPTMEGSTLNNLHEIAERVYDMLMDRLSIERESLGM